MTKNRFIYASLAAALTLTACGTGGEPAAAPSSPASTAPSSTTSAADPVDAGRAAAARLGLPYLGTDVGTVEAAAAKGLPYVFGMGGRDCAWLRLPDDGSLWALHENGTGSSRLTRDRGTEAAFRADPDYEPGRCTPAEGIPTVDDPTQPEPYRWTADFGNTYLRWHGQVFIVPGTVGVGLALTPIAGETIPGVNGVPIPPPATIPN